MRTTVGYSLNIIVKKKNPWEQVPGNPIHWVIYRIHTGPSQLAYLWYNCERFAPRIHFKSRFDRILIKNYHAMCSL